MTALDPPVLEELYTRVAHAGGELDMRCDVCGVRLDFDGPGALRMVEGRLQLCCHTAACLDHFQEAGTLEGRGQERAHATLFKPDDVGDRLG